MEKKRCPNHLTPPSPDPNSGNLVLFFLRQKRRFARMTGKKMMLIMKVAIIIMMIIMTKMTKKTYIYCEV